jgi:hypothetical protein
VDPLAASFVDESPEKCLKRKFVEVVCDNVIDDVKEVSKCLKSKII